MSKYDQSGNNENIDESAYSVFKTSKINLMIWRLLIVVCWVFVLTVLSVMIFAEAMRMTFLQDWMNNNGLLVLLGVLIITIYVNFFLFNYTFLVGNGRVIVYRHRLKGKKKLGEFLSSDYTFGFESIRGKRGGTIGFFLIKSRDSNRRRNKSFPAGLSNFDTERMHYAVGKLSEA